MTDSPTVAGIKHWIATIQNPDLTYTTDVFHRVWIRGRPAVTWLDGPSQPAFVLEQATGREEDYLRNQLSDPASIQRQPGTAGIVRFRITTDADLLILQEIVLARLEGMTTSAMAPLKGPWGQFIHWARRFHASEEFDAWERTYKLDIARNLQHARDAVASDSDQWLKLLRRAFGPPNNLTIHWLHSRFLSWCSEHPTEARAALEAIWNPADPDRIRTFLRYVPNTSTVIRGTGSRLSLASFLQMAIDPLSLPYFRITVFEAGYALTAYPRPGRDADETAHYQHALNFIDRILEEAHDRGFELRDRLDAQSVLWCVANWSVDHPPASTWSHDEQHALLTFRGVDTTRRAESPEITAPSDPEPTTASRSEEQAPSSGSVSK